MNTVRTKPRSEPRRPPSRSSESDGGAFGGFGAPAVQMAERTTQPVLGAYYQAGPVLSLNGNGSSHGANGHGAAGSPVGNGSKGAGGVQFKLAISRPGDPYEREADAAADRVTSGGAVPAISPLGPGALNRMATLQREAAEEEVVQPCACEEEQQGAVEPPRVQRQAAEEPQPAVVQPCENCDEERGGTAQAQAIQRQDAEEENKPADQEEAVQLLAIQGQAGGEEKQEPQVVQPCQNCDEERSEAVQRQNQKDEEPAKVQTAPADGPVASASGDNSIGSTLSQPGAGAPLAPSVRSRLEPGLGSDLSGIRVHHDSTAHQTAHALKARAFTHGQDIWLGAGESPTDTRLMAHEATHVVQQTSGEGGVQLIQREEACEPKKKEEGSEEKAKNAESARATEKCTVTNAPAEQPPEDAEEPKEEEKPADIEANEGAPVNERQANAPPPNEGAPEGEKDVAKSGEKTEAQAQDPCAVREAAGLKKGEAGEVAETGGVKAAEPSPPQAAPLPPEAAGVGAPAGGATEAGAPAAGGPEAGAQGGEGQGAAVQEGGLNAALMQAASPAAIAVQPEGQGEAASPEVADERERSTFSSEEALSSLAETSSTAASIASSEVRFLEPTGEQQRSVYPQANAVASRFLSRTGTRLSRFIEDGMTGAAELREDTAQKKSDLEAEIQQRRDNTQALFTRLRGEAEAQALVATLLVGVRHLLTVGAIEAQATEARGQVTKAYDKQLETLTRANLDQLINLNGAYQTGYDSVIAIGADKGRQARSRAAEHETNYRYANNAPPEVQHKVRNRVKDGFWDGYLTYNRYMARADAAKEVGKQYADGFTEQAKARADLIMCGKPRDLQIFLAIASHGLKSLGCARDNALDAIETQRKLATGLAEKAQREALGAIRSSLKATLAQLDQREGAQLALLSDYGVRQSLAIERDSERAVGAVLQGVNDAAVSVLQYLSQFRAQVDNSPAPTQRQLSRLVENETGQLNRSFSRAQKARDQALTQAQNGLDTGQGQALTALQGLYEGGANDAMELAAGFRQATQDLVAGAMSGYGQIQSTFTDGMTAEVKNSTAILAGIVAGITGVYGKINSGVTARFRETSQDLSKNFQESLDKDLDKKVCAQAEKAAADVQPWWKKVLKVLLIIVVIVVVGLILGPAIIAAVGTALTALAGSLGAGAALAGAIGAWLGPIIGGAIVGAISGAAIQVGSNAIYGKKWNEGLKNAVIAGAIGGALGGLGGKFAQVLVGRIGATGFSRFAMNFGTEAAFDVVGGILGDLATGNPITLEGVLLGAAIGGAVQISMSGLGGLARARVKTAGTEAADSFVSSLARGRIGKAAERITDIQGAAAAAGERAGARLGSFGPRAPTPQATKAALASAEARIQEGEFFPGRARPEPEGAVGRPAEAGGEAVPARPETEAPGARPEAETPTARPSAEETPTARPGRDETTARPIEEPGAATGRRPLDADAAAELSGPANRMNEQDLIDATNTRARVGESEHDFHVSRNGPEVCTACDLTKQHLKRMLSGLPEGPLRARGEALQKLVSEVETRLAEGKSGVDMVRDSARIAAEFRALAEAHPSLARSLEDPRLRSTTGPGGEEIPTSPHLRDLDAIVVRTRTISASDFRTVPMAQGDQAIYILRDRASGAVLKVGLAENHLGRVTQYSNAGNKLGLDLELDVAIVQPRGGKTLRDIEADLRNRLEGEGHVMPWDNYPTGRLGRSDRGTPFVHPVGKDLMWDEHGNLVQKGTGRPPARSRRGVSTPEEVAQFLRDGLTNAEIARIKGVDPSTVSHWKKRWATQIADATERLKAAEEAVIP